MSVFYQLVLSIIQNLALLPAVAMLVILLRDSWCREERFSSQAIFGVLFAVATITASLMPVSATIGLETGSPNPFLRVDLLLLLLAATLVGPVAGALALLMAVMFEILTAGLALTPNLISILSCGILGLVATRWWAGARRTARTVLLAVLALAGAGATAAVNLWELAAFEPLPPEFIIQYTTAIAITFVISALILGRILMWDSERRDHVADLEVVRAGRDAAATGILWVAGDGAITYANQASTLILGYSEEEFKRRHMRDLDTSSSDQESAQRRLSPQSGSWPRIFEARLKNRQDVSVLVEIAANRVEPGDHGEPFTVIGLRRLGRRADLAALPGTTTAAPAGSSSSVPAAAAALAEARTNTDGLTNLGDREMMERTGREMALRAARREIDNMVLAVVDIDDLEGFNERRGFAMGDALLQSYARILRQNLRSDDRAFRFGGDEFAVLMPGRGEGAHDYLRGRFDDMVDAVKGAGFPDAEATCGFAALSEVNYDIHKAIRLAAERVMEAKPPYLRARHARGEKGES